MRTQYVCFLGASVLLGLAATAALGGRGPLSSGGPVALRADRSQPFECFTTAWDGPFEVLSTRYERPTRRLVWVLKARKDTRVGIYEAQLSDGDGVEVATLKVRLDPDRPKVKAGTQIRATLPLAGLDIGDACRVTIRERR